MKLDDNYTIEIDAYNFVLKYEESRQETDKEGKPKTVTSKAEWYYPNINMCLKKYFDESLRDVKELKDVSAAIEAMYETIKKLKISL